MDRLQLLQSVIDRMRHGDQVYREWGYPTIPSRGVVALFAGPPGTGKTLAAEIIAGSLGLDLFKLDLSSVVSKYIGETEQNLEQIFDAAAAGNAVLFFDEADSLFGKRSEVKDARDRYANIEVSYLLQRLEAHDGLIVLATNREKDIDEAFMRRIHVRIEMSLPAPEERLRLWKQSFPASAPLAKDIDFDLLAAKFEIAGGSIRNVATTAAFIAAANGSKITMQAVVTGLAREYRKLGRLFSPTDLGDFESLRPGSRRRALRRAHRGGALPASSSLGTRATRRCAPTARAARRCGRWAHRARPGPRPPARAGSGRSLHPTETTTA